MSEGLLNDKPDMVGFRVLFFISLNIRRKSMRVTDATGTVTTGQFYRTWQGRTKTTFLLTGDRDWPT
jgi:hypothetical protein